MAGFNYQRAKATADRLIARFGRPEPAVLRAPTFTGPDYDPTPGPPVDHPCTVVVVEWETKELETNRVLANDLKLLVAKGELAIDPDPSHKLVVGGVEHTIVGPESGLGVRTVAPGGVTVFYKLQVRR